MAYADRAILSISAPGIKQQFGLSPVQLGYVLSAFSWAYVVGQIPGGLLLDRLGTKAVYGAGAARAMTGIAARPAAPRNKPLRLGP